MALVVLTLEALDVGLLLELHPHQLRDDVRGRRRHHVHEDVEALLLVLLLRIALAVAAETDAVTKVLHVREVLDVLLVEVLEIEVTEHAEEELGAHLLLALLERTGRLRVEEMREVGQVVDVLVVRRLGAEVLDERRLDPLPVPVLRRLVLRAALLDDGADDAVEKIEQALALLREARRDLLHQPLVERLRLLGLLLLRVEAVAPELVDVVPELLHVEDLRHVGDRLRALHLLTRRRHRRAEVEEHVGDGLLHLVPEAIERLDLADLAGRLAVVAEDLGRVDAEQELLTDLVDRLALLVHDVVVLEQVLADVEVAAFDLALRVLDALRHPRVLDGLVVRHAHLLHQRLDAVAGEDAHQVVLEREVEGARARVALTACTAAELVVDAA